MNNAPETTILLADDEDTLRESLAGVLREEGFRVIACRNGSEALRALRTNAVDAMITDLRMPGVSGLDLIRHAVKLDPELVIIVITAFGQVDTAVEAMRMGVRDYICKPLNFDEVIFKLKRLLASDELSKENQVLREQIRQVYTATDIIGESRPVRAIKELVGRVSNTMSNVLICGESGTGKEVVARALHYGGVTSDKPFVAVNCGGLPATLVESELFGYRRGAFTGAESDHIGYFEAANGGTVFLDEIGNLPYPAQAVLLRAIERRAVTRVGESRPRPVHIRVVAATNRDLRKAIAAGDFREDLYYRLNVIGIYVPPLRERIDDIPLLAEHFVEKYNSELNGHCPGFSPEAMTLLVSYPWRGNVRELENVIERALIFADGEPIRPEHLPFSTDGEGPTGALDLRGAIREFERRHILKVLEALKHNKTEAAQALGIGLSSLYRKLEEVGIKANAGEEFLPAEASLWE
jgi:DNA-binding NtrC family response regulator